MSVGGAGRGRGWLNLQSQNAKNVNRPGPGTSPNKPLLSPDSAPNDSTYFSDMSNEYSELVNNVKQLNLSDDGIKFNQKLKYIVERWEKDCNTTNDVENSFEALHKACLCDSELASKLVMMVTSRTFHAQEIQEKNIREMFIRKLQDDFEGRSQFQARSPVAFRNIVQMMGEFFNKAKLSNGQVHGFLVTPLLSCLEMLLEHGQTEDFKQFTTQLYLNGGLFKNELVGKLLNKVRLTLISDKINSKEGKLWLLLALEIAGNRFGILPSEIHAFYQQQLGDASMANFQGTHGMLSVQTTHVSKTLESYQSNVNVLQVSTASEMGNKQVSNTLDYSSQQSYNNSSFNSDASQHAENKHEAGKPGRPILGTGARLNKNRSNDEDNGGKWRDNGWRGNVHKPSANWDGKKVGKASGKAWEHDDRFETDYS